MKILVRIVVSLLIFASSLVFLAPFAHAQTAPFSSLMQTDGNAPVNVTTITQGVFFGMISSLTCIVGGVDYFSSTHKCLSYNPQKGTFGYANTVGGGLLGLQAQGIAMLYTSPFHTADYVKYMASNFGIVKKVYASNGFDQLAPTTKLWLAFRNIAYLLFVIIFVVIGFAIMVRAKIDPRTVMTIENQIPKLVVALILISFSFAIAGLAIDLMWVMVYFVINFFASLDPELASQVGTLTSHVYDNPVGWLNNMSKTLGFLGIAAQAAGGVKEIANVILFGIFQQAGFLKIFTITTFAFPTLISCVLTNWIHINIPLVQAGSDFGGCLDAGFATLFSTLVAAIAFLIFAFALLAAMFRLWWALLKCYTLFLVYVILGPIMIMAGVLPGSKINFDNWLRHIIAYLAVFPTAIGIFLLGKTLMDLYSHTNSGFAPPLIGASPQISNFLGPLLGFAVLMLAPSTANMVQEALQAPDFKFLPQVGQGIAAGGGIVVGGFNKAVTDPLFREANLATGQRAGLLREAIIGSANNPSSNIVIRKLGQWFGYTREGAGK